MINPERKNAIESDPVFQVSVEVVQNKILKGQLPLALQVALSKQLYSALKEFKSTEYPHTSWRLIYPQDAYEYLNNQESLDKLHSSFSDAGYNNRLSTNRLYRNACITSLKMLESGIHTYKEYERYLKYPRKRE
jgi:hypothetical protein